MFLRNVRKSSAGFTLTEVMIAFFIFLLIADAGWTLYKHSAGLSAVSDSSLSAQGDIRKVFGLMSASLRSASQSSLGAYPIAAASSTAITFYSDIDRDGIKERLRYFFSGSVLNQGILKPLGNPLVYTDANEKVSVLASGLIRTASSSLFSYYDSSYDGTTAPLHSPINILNIRLVKVVLTIDSDPTKPPAPMTFTLQASIRNLKDNL